MIVLVDTSGPVCTLIFATDAPIYEAQWEAHRELAKGLLGYIESQLQLQNKTFSDVTAIGVYRGPGSFTGLRIGVTVCATLADALNIPIIGETGEGWKERAIMRLKNGENEQMVQPLYGNDAHITTPRK